MTLALLLASAALLLAPSGATRDDCFLNYTVGETHSYDFASELHVQHDFAHQEGAESVGKRYRKTLRAELTLLGVDAADGARHFALRVRDASWSVADGLVDAFRDADGRVPIGEAALSAAYARAHDGAFYFTQACNGEVLAVYHDAREPAEVVATKKMFVAQLSHRARAAADAAPHAELERDNHGKRSTAYAYRAGDAALGERHVRKSFDVVRQYQPPADIRQTGDSLNTWRARTADDQTTTLRDGIVHRIERRSELDFPPTAASYRGSVGKRDVDESRAEIDADARTDDGEHIKQVKGNSFWLRARGSSTLTHGGLRKRAVAADDLLPAHVASGDRDALVAHLSKRHAAEFAAAEPHTLDESSAPGPGSIDDTLDALLSEDQDMEAAVQLHLLLKHEPDATLAAVERLLRVDSPISDVARSRVLRVVAEVGGAAEQALLRRLVAGNAELDDLAFTLAQRGRAVVAMRALMRPEPATLDALRAVMRLPEHVARGTNGGMNSDTPEDALRKQATLMFGILAENVNASDVDAARAMRSELLERALFARTPDEQHVLMSALDNAYPHDMPNELVLDDRIELGKALHARYAAMADKAKGRQRVLLMREGARVPDYLLPARLQQQTQQRKRPAVPPPVTTDDTVFCDAETNFLLRNVFRDRSGTECEPCDAAIDPRCGECQQQVESTGQRCDPPNCDDPQNLECSAREVDTMVNADGTPCGQDATDNTGQPCMPQLCAACTNCRDPDGRPCGSLCQSDLGSACPEPPSWFEEQFTRFFGENVCAGVERFSQCEATLGKMYNDLRPLKPDIEWNKRIGGEPVTGKIEAVLDAATTDNSRLRLCAEGEDPWQRDNECRREEFIDWKVFAGAWAGLEAYEEGQTYSYNPNAARLEVAAAYLQVKSSVHKFWQTMAENGEGAADDICDKPVEFALYYTFAGKTYYHETSKEVVRDMEGRSTCYLADQTCEPTKPPERAWHTSTKDLYTRYLPDLLGNFDLTGIPLKLELLVKSEARVHHAVTYQYNEFEGGLMLSGFVEPQADCIVTMTASIAWAAQWGNTDEAAEAQEMRNLIRVGIKAHLEVFAVEFPAIGAMNFETSKPCANVELHTRALGGRVDVILEVLGVNVFQFLGGLFGVKQTLYEWKGIEFDIPFVRSKCCILCPGSCQTFNVEENGINGAHSRCDFTKGECVCIPGWDGDECMIPCPESCDVDLGILCDPEQEFTVGNGKFAPRGRCKCEAGSWGYDCSLACPGGRRNPCSMHTDTVMEWKGEEFTTCNSDGTCDCWRFPPRGPFFGPRCDITCGDPNVEPPEDDPDWTRCGRIGESHAECKFDAALGAAECKCARSYYGPKCDQVCPLTQDDRKAPCSLRGDCHEIDGKAVCLCDLGFYGEVCEFIAFDGSGVALAFDGSSPDAKADFPLTPVQLNANAGQGMTMMAWFQAHELPASVRGAPIMKWRLGELRLMKSGKVALCDAQSCLESTEAIEVGTDEAAWYWVAGAMQASTVGSGARRVWLYKAGAVALGAPAEDSQSNSPQGIEVVQLGAAPFKGLIDHAHIIHRMATERDLTDYRVGTVAFSTPGILFQALCDTGRADHVYAETPFVAGPKHESVTWARSHVPLEWATLNSEIGPPLKIADPEKPALRAYRIAFGGKRINKGYVSFRALSPMASGRKRQEDAPDVLQSCRIALHLVDPEEDLETFDANNQPLTDAQLREMDTRERFEIFAEMTVSGSELSSMIDPVELPRNILQRLRTGQVELEWTMLPGQPACNNPTRPLIIENSFMTLHVEQVDGMVQTIGLDTGYASLVPTAPLGATFSFEAWVYLETVRKDARAVADSAIAMLYPAGASVDLVNTKPNFAIFLLGNTDRGAVARYGNTNAEVRNYDLSQRRGEWFHVAFIVDNCQPQLTVDGVPTGTPIAASGCSAVPHWGAGQRHELRIGSKFEGRFNDVIVWNKKIVPRRTMHMIKDYSDPQMAFGLQFDDRQEMSTQGDASLVLSDSRGATAGVSLVRGVIRGHIYGAFHRWKNCPGIDEVLAPERVCGNTLVQERGVCFVEDEENEGVMELAFKCDCNEGFAGKACQKQCLGQIKQGGKTVLCSGHGRCLTASDEDDVYCDCDDGWAGEGCGLTCPGWIEPPPPGQKECSGRGECIASPAGDKAVCKCSANSNSYGLACEYTQSELPVLGCEECTGLNEQCEDDVCVCKHPYWRVGPQCVEASDAARLSLGLLAVIATITSAILL